MKEGDETIFHSCIEKQQALLELFQGLGSTEEKYQKIIELGKQLPPLDASFQTEACRVAGCQSRLYIHSYMKDGKIYFEADADALISKGLAALLVQVFSGETPETVLKCPPLHLQKLGLQEMLTPSRSNGLAAVYLRLKQEALTFLLQKKKEGQ